MNTFFGSGLLAASMFVGQGSEPAPKGGTTVGPVPAATQPSSRPIFGWFSRGDDRPRFGGWFKRDSKDQPKDAGPIQTKGSTIKPAITTPTPLPESNDFPRRLPNPSSQSKTTSPTVAKVKPAAPAKDVQQATLQQIAVPKGGKSPISSQLANKIGRDEQFEWITGQLEIENGNHVLYYATPETVDKFHGRIVLLPQQVDMKEFKKGDLVSVRGTVVQRQTTQGMVPVYRLTIASLIERPKGQ